MQKFLPIVILHGWGANKSRWEGVKSLLEQKGFQVFVPDLPGFGQEPDPPLPWGLEEYANWVVRKTQDWNLEKFILLGHSFGGSVAVKIAADFPEKAVKLILVNSSGIRLTNLSLKMRLWLPIVHFGHFVFTLPMLRNYQQLSRKILYEILGSPDYFGAEGIKKESLKKIFSQDIREDLKKIQAPTWIIWAKKDRQTPLRWAKIFQENIPNSQLKIVEGAGHVFPYHESQEFIDLIESFLL